MNSVDSSRFLDDRTRYTRNWESSDEHLDSIVAGILPFSISNPGSVESNGGRGRRDYYSRYCNVAGLFLRKEK